MKRIVFDLLLLVSVFIFPWWIGFLLLFIGVFLFEDYYEFIVIGTIVYSFYSASNRSLISSPIFISSIFIVLYIVIQVIKNNIILYKK